MLSTTIEEDISTWFRFTIVVSPITKIYIYIYIFDMLHMIVRVIAVNLVQIFSASAK